MTFFRVATVLAILAIAGCGQEAAEDRSKFTQAVSETTFENAYFKLTVEKPADWYAMDLSQSAAMSELGADMMSGDDEQMKAMLNTSLKRTVNIFSFFQYEPGAAVSENLNVAAVAEGVGFLPGIKRGSDYFFHVEKLLEQSAIDVEIEEGYEQRMIGGVEFDQMNLIMDFGEVSVNQSYYAARYEDYIIALVETYTSEDSRESTQAILDSITLDWE